MARGHIYFITKDINQKVDFKASNYHNRLDAIHANSIKDLDNDMSHLLLVEFKTKLRKLGAVAQAENGSFGFSFHFDGVEQMKRNYFRPKLEQLKKEAEDLTLFEVINRRHIPDFNNIINNEHNDLITIGDQEIGSTITMDDFIRDVESGITYYVYNKIIVKQ